MLTYGQGWQVVFVISHGELASKHLIRKLDIQLARSKEASLQSSVLPAEFHHVTQ